MINSQRKKEIVEFLSDVDYRTLKDISEKFDVSMNTVRRDINELADEHIVKKFYGGVSLIKKQDSSFQSRVSSQIEEKRKIAEYAASLVKDHDLIYVDSGSTTSLLTDYLDKNFHLTIVTNNIYVITKAMHVANWDLIVIGSRLKHSSCSLVNVHNWDYINSLNLNKAFLATTGLTVQAGATNPDNAETIIKTSMMKRSQSSYLMMDSSKFDQTSLLTFANIDDFDQIITSGHVSAYYLDYFAGSPVKLHIA